MLENPANPANPAIVMVRAVFNVASAAIAAPMIGLLWYFGRKGKSKGRLTDTEPQPAPSDPPPSNPARAGAPRPVHLRLMPEFHCSPLRDDDSGDPVDPARFGLSVELLQRLTEWDAEFQATFRDDGPPLSGFADVVAEQAWVREGNAIAQDLAQAWPGPFTNRISALTTLLRDARHDLGVWDAIPENRIALIGDKCGVAEIDHAVGWLDDLSRERDAVPEWDGDSQDDVARTQELISGILARVPVRYSDVLASGLRSPEWSTRVYIAMALSRHGRAAALPILRDALAREADDTARQLMTMTVAQLEGHGK